ncbi:MAG: ribosome biogenesis GTP-binding protein YihA/YsxC [Gemmatimonadaceae bacterium]
MRTTPEHAAAVADPLVIRHLEFLGGLASPDGWRPQSELPEIAFGGRSNVGKSSLLNRLVRRKALARVSQTPGKTREINFYLVNRAFTLVDLPGYGYARISKEVRAQWRPLIEGYLRKSTPLRGVVQLIDARRDPAPDDLQMLDFLAELEVPTVIALTKVDKLRRAEVPGRTATLSRTLGLDEDQVIPFSAVTGEGRDELAAAVVALLAQAPWRGESGST